MAKRMLVYGSTIEEACFELATTKFASKYWALFAGKLLLKFCVIGLLLFALQLNWYTILGLSSVLFGCFIYLYIQKRIVDAKRFGQSTEYFNMLNRNYVDDLTALQRIEYEKYKVAKTEIGVLDANDRLLQGRYLYNLTEDGVEDIKAIPTVQELEESLKS